MNLLQRALRKQRAIYRAQTIRRYRKGHPKLGCYKCWYDCYEIKGERCPECNAPIDRGATWWRDGRFSLSKFTLIAILLPIISITGTLWIRWFQRLDDGTTVNNMVYKLLAVGMLHAVPLFLGMPVLIAIASFRTRDNSNAMRRCAFLCAPLLLWMIVASQLPT